MNGILSQTQLEQTVRRIQQEYDDKLQATIKNLQSQINSVNKLALTGSADSSKRPLMNNQHRNTDHRHSVDSWFNETAGSDDQLNECANVYTFEPFDFLTVHDANIDNGSNVLTCPDSNPFFAEMVDRRYVLIEGAGSGGGIFAAKVTGYTSASEVTLSDNAATTVENAEARLNLQLLTHKNKKNSPSDTINDALKDDSHTDFSANIQDPKWRKEQGDVALGKRNILVYPFGYFTDDGITYVPLHQLWPGRIVFARFNVARVNPYVKIKGRLFCGIYNNNPLVLDWVKGGEFELTPVVLGDPFTTATVQYLVVIDTGSGYSIVSQILSVADAPDLTAFNNGAKVKLTWTPFKGAVSTTIYRKIGGGNVFKLETVTSLDREYTDVNNATRQDMGTTSFPEFENGQDKILSYYATPLGALDGLAVNGVSASWQPIEIFLPFSPTVNMATLKDPQFIIGLTEPLATEVQDASLDGSGNIYSVSGAFTAEMIGKNFTIRNQESNLTATGTVSGYTSANAIALSPAPGFIGSDYILEIEESQPHGLLFDLIGTAITEVESEWDFHPDDNNRKQQNVSNPSTGSTQGGIGGSDGYGGGVGSGRCVLADVMISVRGNSNTDIIKKRADEISLEHDLLWNGQGYADDDFNEISWIRKAKVKKIIRLVTASRELPCTLAHRIANSEESKQFGVSISSLMIGNKLLRVGKKSSKLETILDIRTEVGEFTIFSFGLKGKSPRTRHLFVTNDLLSHNLKFGNDEEFPGLLTA